MVKSYKRGTPHTLRTVVYGACEPHDKNSAPASGKQATTKSNGRVIQRDINNAR